jgi:RES domain-containing protein
MASRYKGPLRAFRIRSSKFPPFDGTGAALAGARWNVKGQRVIYASESYAVALLEIMVHSNLGRVPKGFSYIEIDISAELEVEEITATDLPDWADADCVSSQAFGSKWYQEKRSAVLLVPSAAAGGMGRNVLINQAHPELSLVRASAPKPVQWDQRLFGRQSSEWRSACHAGGLS